MIKTENLTKKYGDMFAIKGIELDLEQGDLFGFIGPQRRWQDDHDADHRHAVRTLVG